MKTPIVILGAGGLAKEVFSWISKERYNVIAFYSDAPVYDEMFSIPVVRDISYFRGKSLQFVTAIGDGRIREHIDARAVNAGLLPSDPIIHPTVTLGKNCVISPNTVIAPHAVIGPDVTVHFGCYINLCVTIGHDSTLEPYCTINPGANISGHVFIGRSSTIGTNAAIRENIKIRPRAIVGMGAVVIRDVQRETTVVGNPARQL